MVVGLLKLQTQRDGYVEKYLRTWQKTRSTEAYDAALETGPHMRRCKEANMIAGSRESLSGVGGRAYTASSRSL